MSKILIASKAAVLFLGFSYGFWSEKYCKGRGNKGKLKAGKQATHTHMHMQSSSAVVRTFICMCCIHLKEWALLHGGRLKNLGRYVKKIVGRTPFGRPLV